VQQRSSYDAEERKHADCRRRPRRPGTAFRRGQVRLISGWTGEAAG
jgi:hypothetical protein